ncbi:MAG: DUF4091 domain-containing protein [Gammaproteobacteria bacterium]|nr:DUF4091 domain-containing protein [Gammaproteobacteria bacterium]
MNVLKKIGLVLLFVAPLALALQLTLNYIEENKLEGRAVSELLKKEMEFRTQQKKQAANKPLVECTDSLALKAGLKPKGLLPTGLKAIWAVNDGERLSSTLSDGVSRQDGVVWNGCYVDLVAVRDEVVAFQLVLEAGGSGQHDLHVSMSELSHQDGHKINNDFYLPGGDEADISNSVGRRIEVFREEFLRVKESSRGLYFDEQRQHMLPMGHWADILTPVSVADAFKPLDLAAGRIQPYWVDIYVPRGTPAGSYYGWLSVLTPSSGERYQVPVRLYVAELELPRKFSLQTLAYLADSRQIRRRHGVKSGTPEYAQLLKRYQQMLHRHRLDLVVDKPVRRADQAVADMLSGTIFRADQGYEGPGEGVGTKMLFTQLNTTSKATLQGDIKSWQRWFKEHKLPWSAAVYSIMDEPSEEDYPKVIAHAAWAHEVRPRIKTFLTEKINNALLRRKNPEYIDVWSMPSALSGYDQQSILDRQKAGAQVGVYNGYAPATGTALIDDYAVAMRTWGWAAHKFGLDSWYFWDIAYWHQKRANRATDLWNDPLTYTSGLFGGSAENVGNGDGSLLYPGEDKLFPTSDRGFAGPVASIRLKNWRRGVQDYELLKMATAKGYGTQVKRLVQKMIPKALFESEEGEAISWSQQGALWERARRELIHLMLAKKP